MKFKPKIKLNHKTKKLILTISITTISILFSSTTPVYASGLTELMGNTFGKGGQGAAISVIFALALGSWILEQVTGIIGKAPFGNWIKLAAMFMALLTFVVTALSVVGKIVAYVLP